MNLWRLFDASDFMPRIHCGIGFTQGLVGWTIFGDVLTASAYMVIPFLLVSLYRRYHRSLKLRSLALWFALFIFFCGCGHILNSLMFRLPLYRLYAFENLGTGITSWGTIVVFMLQRRLLMSVMTPEEIEDRIDYIRADAIRQSSEQALSVEAATKKTDAVMANLMQAFQLLDELVAEKKQVEASKATLEKVNERLLHTIAESRPDVRPPRPKS